MEFVKNENDIKIEKICADFKLNQKRRLESLVDRRKYVLRFLNENISNFEYYSHIDRIKDLFMLDRTTIIHMEKSPLSYNSKVNTRLIKSRINHEFPGLILGAIKPYARIKNSIETNEEFNEINTKNKVTENSKTKTTISLNGISIEIISTGRLTINLNENT